MPVDKSEIDPSIPQGTPAPATGEVFPRPQKYGFFNNAGASSEVLAAGTIGAPADMLANPLYRAFQTLRAAHDQGLQGGTDPIGGGPSGVYTDSSGAPATPNMDGYSTKTRLPTGDEMLPVVQDQVKNYTNFDGSNVGQRPLFSWGGLADYSGMAAPYLLGSLINPSGLFRAAPAAARAIPEVAPIFSRILTQIPRTMADSFLSSAVTTPGDLQERALAGGESALIGVPRTATGEIMATGLKRLFGKTVKVGVNPDTGEPLTTASARRVGMAGQQLRQDLGEPGSDFVRNMPATDPEIPGMQLSLGEHLPNDRKAVVLDRTAQTQRPNTFDSLESSQTAAVQDANKGLTTGGNTGDVGSRLNGVYQTALPKAQQGAVTASTALDAQVADFNARVARFNKSGEDVKLSRGEDGNVNVNQWMADNPELAKSAHVKRWASDLEQAQNEHGFQQSRLEDLQNRPQHIISLVGQDPDAAAAHIFSPQVLNETGYVTENSTSRMSDLMNAVRQPSNPTGTFMAQSPFGGAMPRNYPNPSADEALSGIKTMVSDYVGKNYLSKPFTDATQASNFQNFVTQHGDALRQAMGDDGYKVYQAIADRMAQRASVPSNFNTPVALPQTSGGVMHGITSAATGGGVVGTIGVIALEQVAEHLGSGVLSLASHVGGSVGTAIATGAAVGAGTVTAGKVLANAVKAANIKTQADLIALAVRYPQTVGKQLLEAVPPTGLTDKMARGIARAIGGAYAQDQKNQRDTNPSVPTWATDPEVPDWAK